MLKKAGSPEAEKSEKKKTMLILPLSDLLTFRAYNKAFTFSITNCKLLAS